jgi:hypothetical protein
LWARLPEAIRSRRDAARDAARERLVGGLAAARAALARVAEAEGLRLVELMWIPPRLHVHLAPLAADADVDGEPHARAWERVLAELHRLVPDSDGVELQRVDADHLEGRLAAERSRVAAWVEEIDRERPADYPRDGLELAAPDGYGPLSIALSRAAPELDPDADDLAFEIRMRLLARDPTLAELPMEPLLRRSYRVEHREAWVAAEVVALVECLREHPAREDPYLDLSDAGFELRDDALALLLDALAWHQAEGRGLGDALWFSAEAIASMRTRRPTFIVAHDRTGEGRTLIRTVDREEQGYLFWHPGLLQHAELRRAGGERGQLGALLAGLVRERGDQLPAEYLARLEAVKRAREEARERARERRALRAARFAAEGWVALRPRPVAPVAEPDLAVEVTWPTPAGAVRFVPRGGRDHVLLPGGAEVPLPSPQWYRFRAALTPDSTRLLVASTTRLREVDLATGAVTVRLQGPSILGVAALAGDRAAVVCGGRVVLDRGDPDVAALDSVRDLPPRQHRVTVEGKPGLQLVGGRFYDIPDLVGATSVLEGRILVLSRARRGGWATMVLAVKDGALIPLRKLSEALRGFELVGLEAAWQAARPMRLAAIELRLGLEVAAPEPRRCPLATSCPALSLVPSDEPPAPAPAPPPEARAIAADLGLDVDRCQIATLGAREALLLVRSAQQNTHLDLVVRAATGRWHPLRRLATHVFDRLLAVPARRLAILTLAHAAAGEAITLLVQVAPSGTFHLLADARTRCERVFERAGHLYLEVGDGVRELVGLDACPTSDPALRLWLEPFPGGPRLKLTTARR